MSTTLADVKVILMRRDGATEEEALEMIQEAIDRVRAGDDPEEVCYEEFGLEPDYVFDLIEAAMRKVK